jgi:glycine/D-amino acid oxidase-like deaminating enzyme
MSAKQIVIIGSGIQGTSVAYHLHKSSSLPPDSTITLLEAKEPASAASGKGGGFMARSWGSGPTVGLHELSFDLYQELCEELQVESYRKLPVLSVSPGYGTKSTSKTSVKSPLIPSWLDGSVGRISPLGMGEDTAQVTPKEFVDKMLECMTQADKGVKLILGTCTGIECRQESDGSKSITGVQYQTKDSKTEHSLPASDIIVSAGPWSCQAQEWFDNAVSLPMEGVKSTSIVWKPPLDPKGNPINVDATALFCGEDDRFGTHLEVYPRPDGTIYICGIGGSDYISTSQLQSCAFLEECPPREDRANAATKAFTTMSNTYKEKGELMTIQACMRPCPPDALPYMGTVPGYNGAFINAGHNCWGIAWAPGCGKVMAELVLEGKCKCLDLRPFDPARFTMSGGRGGRGRKKGSLNVGEQW